MREIRGGGRRGLRECSTSVRVAVSWPRLYAEYPRRQTDRIEWQSMEVVVVSGYEYKCRESNPTLGLIASTVGRNSKQMNFRISQSVPNPSFPKVDDKVIIEAHRHPFVTTAQTCFLHDVLLALLVLARNLKVLLRPFKRPNFPWPSLFYFLIHFTSLTPLTFAFLLLSIALSRICLLSADLPPSQGSSNRNPGIMYTPTVLFTLLVLGFAAAQNSTSTFDASQVDPTLRSECLLHTSTISTSLTSIR